MKKRESIVSEQKSASIELEKTLASLGALSAVRIIRKCYPASETVNTYTLRS